MGGNEQMLGKFTNIDDTVNAEVGPGEQADGDHTRDVRDEVIGKIASGEFTD